MVLPAWTKVLIGAVALAALVAGGVWFAMPRDRTFTVVEFDLENARGDADGTPPLTVAMEEAKRLYGDGGGKVSGGFASSGELSVTVRGIVDVDALTAALRRRLGDPVVVTGKETVTQTVWFCPTC